MARLSSFWLEIWRETIFVVLLHKEMTDNYEKTLTSTLFALTLPAHVCRSGAHTETLRHGNHNH